MSKIDNIESINTTDLQKTCVQNNTVKYISKKKFVVYSLLTAIAFVLISSCAKKSYFQVSSIVPAARGFVKVKKDSNKNYSISVNLLNLAEPGRLTPAKQCYIVWLVTSENETKNVGQITTSTSLLSKTLKGYLETVSPVKPLRVFITAEDNSVIQYPSAAIILTTSNF